mmetsp:Transcript_19426/g.29852  ORF Transcript_19426/g.29852 Transcript_19426/m.29852 type:complete len:210 (-) Transcript_19426:104-733(-)|eukprot:CAMPEP_0170492252 /NCGR_PEP_ID=MMETSP0208-20121228/11912_1 /TAXON_ID=197538 /ORGANISM="Strombidium inclinatum, Strain S3" /LENGTH=209 /DNA_ID=CAMNT_0010767961 /DNA_START=487 /DNA_END=1116 /DNA_ORIENTATION=-
MSRWFALLELCEDLVQRTKLYGVNQFLDHSFKVGDFRENWTIIKENQNKGLYNQALHCVYSVAMILFSKVGVTGSLKTTFEHWATHQAYLHPGMFVAVLLVSVAVTGSSSLIKNKVALMRLAKLTERFDTLNSNLFISYQRASVAVAESFVTKDPYYLRAVFDSLEEGSYKLSEGTLKHFFDDRDKDLEHLQADELKVSGCGEWTNVSM